jgi:hypothetical protein
MEALVSVSGTRNYHDNVRGRMSELAFTLGNLASYCRELVL